MTIENDVRDEWVHEKTSENSYALLFFSPQNMPQNKGLRSGNLIWYSWRLLAHLCITHTPDRARRFKTSNTDSPLGYLEDFFRLSTRIYPLVYQRNWKLNANNFEVQHTSIRPRWYDDVCLYYWVNLSAFKKYICHGLLVYVPLVTFVVVSTFSHLLFVRAFLSEVHSHSFVGRYNKI